MKLPDFSIEAQLNSLRERIGAPLRQYEATHASNMLTIEEIEILAREGLDIPLSDVTALEDGTLIYKNRRVVLYIRDVKQYRRAYCAVKRLWSGVQYCRRSHQERARL
jgi:hypothetical protein